MPTGKVPQGFQHRDLTEEEFDAKIKEVDLFESPAAHALCVCVVVAG